jgi:hypothetical protein
MRRMRPAAMRCPHALVALALLASCTGESLRLTAGREPSALLITNLEGDTLEDCRLVVDDAQLGMWIASVEEIRPSQTVTLPWNTFTSGDEPMPAYIGVKVERVEAICYLQRSKAGRTVALVF